MKNRYVNIRKHWKIIKPIAQSKKATEIWMRDLNKHHVAFRIYGHRLSNDYFDENWFNQIHVFSHYIPNGKPSDYDSCDWRCNRIGRNPGFWDFVVHGKCHCMVNFNLFVAQNTFPKKPWRVITSDIHSCVWDGKKRLFDMNYSALVPDIKEHPFYNKLDKSVEVLPIGKELEIGIRDRHVQILESYDMGLVSLGDIIDIFFGGFELKEKTYFSEWRSLTRRPII